MSKYWLTTHWPPCPDGRDTLHVYVQKQHRSALEGMKRGDKVLIYEFKTGPAVVRNTDGRTQRVARLPGRQGVICAAEIAGSLEPAPAEAREQYADRAPADWAWYAPPPTASMAMFPARP